VPREDLRHEFAATANPDLVKDELQMLLDSEVGYRKRGGDCGGGQATQHKLCDLSFTTGKAVGLQQKWCNVGRSPRLQNDSGLSHSHAPRQP
jgi:hypothetical protein